MTIQAHATNKLAELNKELRTIAKWFGRTHGGPVIYDGDLAEMEPELRTVTQAMIDRRSVVAEEIADWKKHVDA